MSDEEADRSGSSGAWQAGAALENRDVLDVDGTRLGRVTRCFVEGGRLAYCDVRLDVDVRRAFNMEEDITWMDPSWIADVGDEGVKLNRAAAQVVDPESRGGGPSGGAGGSESFPRGNR